jgi:hypothetical protein
MFVLSNFATATRNYAKRQLHWYRKDDKFLWLQIARPDPAAQSTDRSPYMRVAEEVQYWCRLPDNVYQKAIDNQMKSSQALTTVRGRKYHGHNFEIPHLFARMALAYAIAKGEVKVPDWAIPKPPTKATTGSGGGATVVTSPTTTSKNDTEPSNDASDGLFNTGTEVAAAVTDDADKVEGWEAPVKVPSSSWITEIFDPSKGVTPETYTKPPLWSALGKTEHTHIRTYSRHDRCVKAETTTAIVCFHSCGHCRNCVCISTAVRYDRHRYPSKRADGQQEVQGAN